jgi:hypothetical protein
VEQVTKYNHVTLGTEERPLIPNLIFKETLESLNNGETEFYELVRQEYSFESYQKMLAEHKYRELINNK